MTEAVTPHVPLSAGEVDSYVEVQGDGPPVVMLHGFTGDTTTLQDLADRLDGSGRRILVDLLGHGRTDAPDRHVYTVDDYVTQIGAVVAPLDTPPVLLGYSMGARLALAAALAGVPTRGLVLIGGRAGIADADQRTLRRYSDDALADDLEQRGLDWFVDFWASRPFYASQFALGEEHIETARRQRLRNAPRGLAAALRGAGAGAQEAFHARLAEVAVPVLVVIGELDVSFRLHAEELISGLPDAELAMIPAAGHATHLEAPGETARRIRAFLTRV